MFSLIFFTFLFLNFDQENTIIKCKDLYSKEKNEIALKTCRDAYNINNNSIELIRILAELEYSAGDPFKSAKLWDLLISKEGYKYEYSLAKANALLNAGDVMEAEEIFKYNIEKENNFDSYKRLIDFYISFQNFSEAIKLSRKAQIIFPDKCELIELEGISNIGLDKDKEAIFLIKKAISKGCPSFRWADRYLNTDKLEKEIYKELLNPYEILENFENLNLEEIVFRLKLLNYVMIPEVADKVSDIILENKNFLVKNYGLYLLTLLDEKAISSWEKILNSDDFLTRKYALRKIREIGNPFFIPLLEKNIEKEKMIHNKNLTYLTLGELYLKKEELEKSKKYLKMIPSRDFIYPLALYDLAILEEKNKNYEKALKLLKKIQKISPGFVDKKEFERIKNLKNKKNLLN